MKTSRLALCAVTVMIVSLAFPTNATFAAQYYSVPDTTIYNYKYENGTIPRTVGVPEPGWPVAFQKVDGPKMKMGAINCVTGAMYDEGTLADNDPPIAYEKVAIIAQGTTFCTTWKGLGSNSSDTYRGTLTWDG